MRRTAWWLAGAAAAWLLTWLPPALVQRLDLLAYDLLLPERAPSPTAPLVLAIDDASLAALGRWPWSRSVFAAMIDRLREAGASGIAVAVLFSEPDRADPGGDAALAAAMARFSDHGRVVLAVAPVRDAEGRIQAAAPELPQTGARLGHVDVEIDLDGQSRSFYRRAGTGRADLPALAAALLEDAAAPRAPPTAAPLDRLWVRDEEILLPRTTGVPMLSFAQALQWPVATSALDGVRGRAVFIGVTASGLGGELNTPLAARHATLPAVLFHAQAFDALQSRAVIRRAPWPLVFALGLLSVSSLALWPARLGRRTLLAGVLLLLPLAVSALLMAGSLLWLPPAGPTLALAVALACWLARKLRRANRQLLRSRQHAQATLQAIDDAVMTVDMRRQTVRFANPTAYLQAGGRPLLGLPLPAAYPLTAESMQRLVQAVDDCLAQRRRVHLPELLNLQAPAGLRALRATASPLHGPDGGLDGAVLVFADVTDAIAAARELDRAASHDGLTGLPNRALLYERLALTLSRIQRRGGVAAILFLDLDRFKHINDSLGHRIGDEVLKVLAQRLRGLCRDTDTVARWGGDEFVLILEDIGGHEGAAIAAAKVVDALSQDIELDTGFSHVRLPSAGSVGVVLAPQDGTDMEDLLSKADMAMYRAKAQPRASFQFWSSAINTRMHDRLALEMALRQGLREGQFVLYYQPQFDFQDGRLVGMEALMRWQRTPAQLVQPGGFIEVAEESDLIVDLGAWALREVARQQADWLRAGHRAVPVGVNVSARQCLNRDLVQVLRLALGETGIPPALLRLEITETTAMTDADQVIGLLCELRALGVGLSVDDFGTGYSSLAYLKRFPLDELKIDRAFVQDLATDSHDAAIVRATIVLAHGLGLKVVAEGVETEAQSRFLAEHGCDTAQGFLFSRPLPLAAVTRLLQRGELAPPPASR
ncbi:hypothetical protein RD110_13665 [Rhodoferax koreense]|uniref:Diguanylate cyclase n=1 Tax=Rhodoferax koreensis TaxID=1842727 RepID=A0A1P8JWI3_9BURK|nr:hypothetical protein RD110_13665 [Rhodoferax koreense]